MKSIYFSGANHIGMKQGNIWAVFALGICLLLAVTAAGCISQPAEETEVTVFAAASLTGALTELKQQFEAENPNIKVIYNFAGSQTLKTQILEGADCDIYISANNKQFDPVVEAGLIEDKQILLQNKLGIAVVKGNPLSIKDLGSLSADNVRLAIGDEAVPFGQYTRQIIAKYQDDGHAGYVDAFMENVITQVDAVDKIKSYLTLGEADASIVYVSDISKTDRNSIDIIEIPDAYNVIADYPYGICKNTKNADAAEKFAAFLTGPKGDAVLLDYGFSPVN